MRYNGYNIFNNKVNMSNFEKSIEYINNSDSGDIYYGLCDKINVTNNGSKHIIELDIEKILGKYNLRNIQSIRLKHQVLVNEINSFNRRNLLLLSFLVIIIIIFLIV